MMKFILKDRETKDWKPFNFQMKPDDHKRLAALAKERGLSVAEIMRQALHYALENTDQK